jgi:hypothetical protein
MQHSIFGARLAAPLALLVFVTGTASAQTRSATPQATQSSQQRAQSAPAEAPSDKGTVNPTRQLEAEIEEYPAPNEGPSGTATDAAEVVIPEVIEQPGQATKPPAKPATPMKTSSAPAGSRIDARDVQRVFGQDVSVLELAALDAKQATRLQQRLRELGHYLGKIDGIVGPQTRAALQALIADQFAMSQRLLRYGQMTTDLAAQVGLPEPSRAEPGRPQ